GCRGRVPGARRIGSRLARLTRGLGELLGRRRGFRDADEHVVALIRVRGKTSRAAAVSLTVALEVSPPAPGPGRLRSLRAHLINAATRYLPAVKSNPQALQASCRPWPVDPPLDLWTTKRPVTRLFEPGRFPWVSSVACGILRGLCRR